VSRIIVFYAAVELVPYSKVTHLRDYHIR